MSLPPAWISISTLSLTRRMNVLGVSMPHWTEGMVILVLHFIFSVPVWTVIFSVKW